MKRNIGLASLDNQASNRLIKVRNGAGSDESEIPSCQRHQRVCQKVYQTNDIQVAFFAGQDMRRTGIATGHEAETHYHLADRLVQWQIDWAIRVLKFSTDILQIVGDPDWLEASEDVSAHCISEST